MKAQWSMVCIFNMLVLGCGCGPESTSRSGAEQESPVGAWGRASSIHAESLREVVTVLASDEMEGRGPGTEGDVRARGELIRRLKKAGYQPAFGQHAWEQPISIVGVTTKLPDQWTFRANDGGEVSFRRWDEYMGAVGTQRAATSIQEAEVVFVGYGIQAPEEAWDDFKGVDLRGKVLLMLNDDPDWDPDLFAGERKLYYGRWSSKYESAAAQGAAAAIIIHTTPSAGYPWQVVQTSWNGEQFEVPAGDEPRLGFKAWLTEGSASRLVALAGYDLDALVAAARRRDFRPVGLGVTTSLALRATMRNTETANVGGVLPGADPLLKHEVLVLSAHHDHLGIGEPDETGDRIYNGARDNGIAMACALAVAEAISALPERPRRSVLVLFVAAEEQGLLGSEYFAREPTVPPGRIAANINFELGNIWGRTRDVTIYGMGKSTVEDLLSRAAKNQGRYVTEEKDVRAGWYYRSDQLSFARIGVPAIWFTSGTDFVDRPKGWGEAREAEWIAETYHQPSDEIDDSWNLEGAVEDAELALELAVRIANADQMPTWYPGDEFEDERVRALAEVAR
jgi:Zn-dependent M28 family amino/carboxypeptidase